MSPYPYKDLTEVRISIASGLYSYFSGYTVSPIKEETKKEKTSRIAKEKMLASWKTYNQKTEHIIELKQICKPQHRSNNIGYRGFKK